MGRRRNGICPPFVLFFFFLNLAVLILNLSIFPVVKNSPVPKCPIENWYSIRDMLLGVSISSFLLSMLSILFDIGMLLSEGKDDEGYGCNLCIGLVGWVTSPMYIGLFSWLVNVLNQEGHHSVCLKESIPVRDACIMLVFTYCVGFLAKSRYIITTYQSGPNRRNRRTRMSTGHSEYLDSIK